MYEAALVGCAREYGCDRNGEKWADLIKEAGGKTKKNQLGCEGWEEGT